MEDRIQLRDKTGLKQEMNKEYLLYGFHSLSEYTRFILHNRKKAIKDLTRKNNL